MKKLTLILSLVASLNSFADYTGECASSLKPFVKDLEVDMRVNSRIVLTELDGASINGTSLDRSDNLEIVEVGVHQKLGKYSSMDPFYSYLIAVKKDTCDVLDSEFVDTFEIR